MGSEIAVEERLMFLYTPLSEPLFAPSRRDRRCEELARRLGSGGMPTLDPAQSARR